MNDNEPLSDRGLWALFITVLNDLEIADIDRFDAMMYYYYGRTWGWYDGD
jgi:hypothetical protein